MAALIKRKVTPLEATITRLTSGHGSQRLPAALRTIEIQNVPTRGCKKGQRAFLQTILPRIKFHNSQLEVMTHWRKMPDRKGKKGSKEVDAPPQADVRPDVAGSSKAATIQLHFDEFPSQELRMGQKSVTEITREMLELIHSTVRVPMEEAEEGVVVGEEAEEGVIGVEAEGRANLASEKAATPTTPL